MCTRGPACVLCCQTSVGSLICCLTEWFGNGACGRGWNGTIVEVPSNPRQSVIL